MIVIDTLSENLLPILIGLTNGWRSITTLARGGFWKGLGSLASVCLAILAIILIVNQFVMPLPLRQYRQFFVFYIGSVFVASAVRRVFDAWQHHRKERLSQGNT